METDSSSFSTSQSYFKALAHTPSRLARRALSVSSSYEELSRVRARSGSDMQRSLRWFDLVGLGIGGMVGAGVFVTTGTASRLCAGPSIIISYAIAGLCALLSAFCYTEFAVHLPVAGGAFSYLRITFGEFAAFFTGANLIVEYVMSNAAVARSFTSYFGAAIGISTAKWRFTVHGLPKGFNEIDLVAVAVVLILTLIICYSTRESSLLNMILTALHVLFIAFVIVMGLWRGDWTNFTHSGNPQNPSGFFPYGASGVFNGAAVVYFSYIGYDAVSTMAEEVRNPVKDIPIGVSGSVIIVTILYSLMAVSMSKLIPYDLVLITTSTTNSVSFLIFNFVRGLNRVIGCGDEHADRCGGAIFGGVQWEIIIGGVGVGAEGDRGGGQLRDTNVAVGVDVGTGSVHVRHRTVQRGPGMVRQGPPYNINPCQRIRVSWNFHSRNCTFH
ncbi:hypothetical protein PTKIN_Ptkin01aG0269600 [Pterospermum kingtungense]